MKNRIIPYNPKLKIYARELRNNSTLAEVLIWQKVKGKSFGVEFHRQVPMLEYFVDFYCHELKMVVEIDGESHEFKYDYDQKRQSDKATKRQSDKATKRIRKVRSHTLAFY